MKRRSSAPVTPKPARASKRIAAVVTTLKTARTKLDTMLKTKSVDDVEHTEEGKKLRKEAWVAKEKLNGVLLWLARIGADYRRCETDLRNELKLKALGVDPEEVLSRSEPEEQRSPA